MFKEKRSDETLSPSQLAAPKQRPARAGSKDLFGSKIGVSETT